MAGAFCCNSVPFTSMLSTIRHLARVHIWVRCGMGTRVIPATFLRETAKAAYGAVELPEAVIDILAGLRNWLQATALGPLAP